MNRSILRHALQIAFPIRTESSAGAEININHWEPWDPVARTLSAADAFGGSGIRLDHVSEGSGRASVELFLPWHLVGNPGFAQAPEPGTRLAIMVGFSHPDGTKFCWPHRQDPWAADAMGAERVAKVYGECVVLE